jgi:ribonucleoside-triphosphate reductase
VQQTLEGLAVSAMPRVRTTDGHLLDWDREAIAKQLLKETKLSEQFYKEPGITEEEAQDIAKEVERRVRWMNVQYLSGPLVREIMNVILLERHHTEWRNICTRVGTPVYDAHLIDIGTGFESKENANLQENAETSHKKKADKISKEQYLLLLPPHLADRHLAGDLHIHDLEYFGTRPFCLDGSTEVNFRGTIPFPVTLQSANGTSCTVQAPLVDDVICLDGLPFGDCDSITFPVNTFSVLTPKGYLPVLKASRRPAKPNEMLSLVTESNKRLLATKDHRIPVKTAKGMDIMTAGELSVGDMLYGAADFAHEDLRVLPGGDATIRRIEPVNPSGKYVYDLFIKGDDSEESHTFFTANGLLVHNCQDWDLRYFLYYGLMPDGLGTKASVAGPAKKPEVAMLHAVKALGSAQTNFAGGQGFYNFLTFIAPYFESKSYAEIVQLMQMFVYEMTQMMVARGGQLVFSSVQLTPGVPKLWRDKPAVYAGKVWNGSSPDAPLKTYGQFEREVRLAFKALMEVMLAGDYWGKPFNFPKPEISIEPDFMKEDEAFNTAHPDLPTYQQLYLLTFKLAAEYGTPYFDNQLPAYRGAGEGISCYQCLAKDELVPFVGESGELQIKQIDDLFEIAAKNGFDTDLNGVEFAKLNAKTPSVNFDTLKTSLNAFRGVMRQSYHGKLLKITLTTGRRIRVTPNHPVFALENGSFAKKQAKELDVGEFLPILKNANVRTVLKSYLDVNKTLTDAGFSSEIQSNETEVNIKNAKKRGLPKQIPITEELIKFLGYYLAEGCIDHCARRYSVRLSFGKHETQLIEDSLRCMRGLGFEPTVSVEKTASNVVVNSKLLYLLIDALGCGHNAHDKSVPDLLFNIEPSLVGQYICCAFKGDGNINIQLDEIRGYTHIAHNIRMKLVSRDAVQRLIFLAQRIGIQMNYMVRDETVKHPHTGEPYQLTSYTCYITSQDQIQRFQREVGYGDCAVAQSELNVGGAFTRVPIKESCIEYSNLKYPSQYQSSGYRCVNQQLILDTQATDAIQKLLQGDIHPLKIKKIEEEDYDGYVYDLVDVSETHNFCNALGVVTGNCCAYQFAATYDSDSQFEDKLYFKDGKHFSMGSWQVVSLNCPRAAYLARGDDELLFEYLRELMDTSVEIFKVKREWMNQIIKNHRMPFATQQPRDPSTGEKGSIAVGLEGLVYTIGVVGVNEMVQFHTGKQMHEAREAWKLAVRAMTEMEIYAKKLSLQHGMTIALARTPAETTAQRFAVSDLIHEEFRDCAEKVVKGDLDAVKKNVHKTRDLPVYYTNGTHLPPSADVTIFERAKLEHVFFPIVDGGNIFHIFMGEATPDPQGLMDFGMRLAKETQIGYFTFSRDMTVCLGCAQVSGGLEDKCPSCGSEDVDHISRITGYLQAVSGWNNAKRQELKDRKRYNELA